MKNEKCKIDQIMEEAIHDFKIDGIIVTDDQQQLVKKRILGEISEDEFIRLVLEKSSE